MFGKSLRQNRRLQGDSANIKKESARKPAPFGRKSKEDKRKALEIKL